MVGFDESKPYPGQKDWLDVVYAGDDGSILVLLGDDYTPHKPRGGLRPELWHEATKARKGDWYQLRQAKDESNGRWYVLVRRKTETSKRCYVPRLVLWAWCGMPENETFGNQLGRHRNDVASDNRRTNLEWGSAAQNRADREAHANRQRAERGVQLLEGVKIVLEYSAGSWDLKASRHGLDLVLPSPEKIRSPRRTDANRIVKSAIDDIKGGTADLTPEKWPKKFHGFGPSFEGSLPADGFEPPDEGDEEFIASYGENRSKEIKTEAGRGIFYEFIKRIG
jgi:hypothetical protein